MSIINFSSASAGFYLRRKKVVLRGPRRNRRNLVSVIRRKGRWRLCWQLLPLLVPCFQVCQQNFLPTEIRSCFRFCLISSSSRPHSALLPPPLLSHLASKVTKLCPAGVCTCLTNLSSLVQAGRGCVEAPGFLIVFTGVRSGSKLQRAKQK